jgi:hypothetical protein
LGMFFLTLRPRRCCRAMIQVSLQSTVWGWDSGWWKTSAFRAKPSDYFLAGAFFLPATVFLTPLRVRALVRVR